MFEKLNNADVSACVSLISIVLVFMGNVGNLLCLLFDQFCKLKW